MVYVVVVVEGVEDEASQVFEVIGERHDSVITYVNDVSFLSCVLYCVLSFSSCLVAFLGRFSY